VPTAFDGYRRGDRSRFYGHVLGHAMTPAQIETYLAESTTMMDRYLDLVEAGVDLLAETSKACRRNRISPWLSVRMNDMHGANSLAGSFMNAPLLAHEEFRLKGLSYDDTQPPAQARMALNFEKREVRDFMFSMIRELVEDYDFEGMELDWTRHQYICNPVASQKTIDMMTAWHGQIAELCRRRAKATGKPYSLGIRCSAVFPHLRHIGLDVHAIARAGFLDFVCPTRDGWTTTWDLPHDQMREAFGENVAVYGVVEDAPNWLPAYAPRAKHRHYLRYSSASAAMLRGNAAGKLALGADGIEAFNFFCTDLGAIVPGLRGLPDYPSLKGLADPAYLRGKRKFYSFSAGFETWGVRTIVEVDEHLPQWFEPTTQRRFRLPMGAEPAGMDLTIQVVVERPGAQGNESGKGAGVREAKAGKAAAPPPLGVSFNDSWLVWKCEPSDALLEPTGDLTHHAPEHMAMNFRFPAAAIRGGWNEILIAHGAADPGEPAKRREPGVRVVAIELLVEPGKKKRRGRARKA
jgi:hypothetical protein